MEGKLQQNRRQDRTADHRDDHRGHHRRAEYAHGKAAVGYNQRHFAAADHAHAHLHTLPAGKAAGFCAQAAAH